MSKCEATLTWTPRDWENGRDLPERTETCSRKAGHTGYHKGQGGPFGPHIPEASDSGSAS